jgi:hypothetical protein
MRTPQQLTEDIVEAAMCGTEPSHYQDFDDFAKDCHSVSLALVRTKLLGEPPEVRVARGACLGVPGQHSWVVVGDPFLPQSPIVDLTLWSYDSSKPRIWFGSMEDGLHRPKGYGAIHQTPMPEHKGGETLPLDAEGLSDWATRFLKTIGPLDARGWAGFWSHCGMLGWPAGEVLNAFLDQHPQMAAIVPIDLVGMLTDRNPHNLYW